MLGQGIFFKKINKIKFLESAIEIISENSDIKIILHFV